MDKIIITGAREHNLKNIDVELPRDRLVVVTGLSGSGKSSLAFDTIYAEGQRRYVESLSAYARQFLEQMGKPDVDSIEGLSPAISIEQKSTSRNPRSTVGTVTEIYDYLRLLYARIGVVHCYQCGQPIASQTVEQMVDRVLALPAGTRLSILAPLVRGRKGEYRKELADLRSQGFVRVAIDGKLHQLEDPIKLDKNRKHTIEVYVDRLVIKDPKGPLRQRLGESLELGLRLADGIVKVAILGGEDLLFSERFACVNCGVSYPEVTPRLFSFNSPQGACPKCNGLGVLLPSEQDGAELDEEVPLYLSQEPCDACQGTRLKREAHFIKVGGKSISEVVALSIKEAQRFFLQLKLRAREREIGDRILREIRERLNFLINVGLDYLTLDRTAATLAGGEAQRIRLATQIGSSLVGVLYILDEPSIGLHQRDNHRLLATLTRLRDMGNTVIVVEHDEETIRTADYVVDLGPRAGVHGGRVVAAGTPEEIMSSTGSLTGDYLTGRKKIELPKVRRQPSDCWLTVRRARAHNLHDIDVRFPVGLFTCVTGVSGSGKSTLVIDTLQRALAGKLQQAQATAGAHDAITGFEYIDKVIDIDQLPIGRTPRSNPATYTGLFTPIRELFSALPESRARGYLPGRYSFNVKGGRCEACQGDGTLRIEMHFLPDVYVECEVCGGRRYNRETLDVKYRGASIADVLEMTVDQALEFLTNVPAIRQKLVTLQDVGLGYLTLGQAATTLSGGEAQRIKLSRELARRSTGRTLYILDEPTTGLHFDDIRQLLSVLNRLVDQGNTVIVIEHQLDVIKTADYVIDLGPEGGDEGGRVVAVGTPEQIAACAASHTGHYLRKVL